MDYFKIIIFAVFVNNIVLVQFLGLCPCFGVGNKIKVAAGMGVAITFVITVANLITYFLYKYFLLPLNIEFMKTITFILVIASLVQIIETIIKKVSPVLYKTLGIYLLLITTNCAVLGTVILALQKNYNFLHSFVYSFSTSIGFVLVIILMAGINEQLEISGVPKGMKGFPISLITAGILSMAFMGFAGLA